MDINKCQNCQKTFDQGLRVPKRLGCGCIQCQKCIQKVFKITDVIKCKTHKKEVSIESQNLKDVSILEHLQQEIGRFEQSSNLVELIKDLSQQIDVQKTKIISIEKHSLDYQKLIIEIVSQVTQFLYQNQVNECQNSIAKIQDLIKKLVSISDNLQQMKATQENQNQEYNEGIKQLEKISKEFQSLQNEISQVRKIWEQQGNTNEIQDITKINIFSSTQDIINNYTSQRLKGPLIKEIIKNYFTSQNIKTKNQTIKKQVSQEQIIKKEPQQPQQQIQSQIIQQANKEQNVIQQNQQIKIGNIQNLEIFMKDLKNLQLDVAQITQSSISTTDINKKTDFLLEFRQINKAENQKSLIQIINQSKYQPQIQQAVANAVSLLNYMNYSFTELSLQGINFSNADISDQIFTNCNLSDSNFQLQL